MRPSAIEIDPSVGVPPLLFGMTRAQTLVALEGMGGEVDESSPPGGAPSIHVLDPEGGFDIYANLRGDGRLFTIEIWRPAEIDGSVPVRFVGVDLFGYTADSTIALLRARGVEVVEDDPFFPDAAESQVRFNRDGGDDRDDEGRSVYFESITVVPRGYDTEYTSLRLPEIPELS
jgi:hypothetical protein